MTERARDELTRAYGPLFSTEPDPRGADADARRRRTAGFAPGTRYVLCDPQADRASSRSTATTSTRRAPDAEPAAATSALPQRRLRRRRRPRGRSAGARRRRVDRPFSRTVELAGVPVEVRMESWLAADTIRRMGFGHVVAARHHALIVERGVSFVAFDGSGRPLTHGLRRQHLRAPAAVPHQRAASVSSGRLSRCYRSARPRGARSWHVLWLDMARARWSLLAACAARRRGRAAESTAQELAQALQKQVRRHHGLLRRLRPHATRAACSASSVTERGHVLVKKPGKMRWDYTAPEKKLFVSDGVKIYSYMPAGQAGDRQRACRSDDEATTPALFLAGKGNLTRDFTPSLVDAPAGTPPARRALKLVPKSPQRDYDWLVLAVDPATLAHPRARHDGRPGRHIDLHLHEPEGKHRIVR